MMKVALLLACHPRVDTEWNHLPPMGLGYLASYVQKQMPEVEFVIDYDVDRVIASKPDLVGITFVTFNANYAKHLSQHIKEVLGCPVICGGPHISTLPTNLGEHFDLAVLKEGEETFAELMRLYMAKKEFAPEDLAKIPGIAYRDKKGTLVQTTPRALIKDLDTIPYPNRDLLCEHWPQGRREATIITSRGCPFNCAFCSTVQLWGRGYRLCSDEYVLGEMQEIRSFEIPHTLHFYDDLFVGNKERALRLLGKIRERGLNAGIETMTCLVRANLLDDELMESLLSTGIRILNIGFESGSNAVLEAFNKQAVDLEVNKRAVKLARRHGATYSSTFIIGAPGETRNDMMATFDFVVDNADVFNLVKFSPLQVFPGTQVWEWAKEVGVSESNMTGVVIEPEDFDISPDEYYIKRWPYLNAKNMPVEDLVFYYRIAQQIEKLIDRQTELRNALDVARAKAADTGSVENIAKNVPFSRIMKEKLKRKFSGK